MYLTNFVLEYSQALPFYNQFIIVIVFTFLCITFFLWWRIIKWYWSPLSTCQTICTEFQIYWANVKSKSILRSGPLERRNAHQKLNQIFLFYLKHQTTFCLHLYFFKIQTLFLCLNKKKILEYVLATQHNCKWQVSAILFHIISFNIATLFLQVVCMHNVLFTMSDYSIL